MKILKTYNQLFENDRPLLSFLASYIDTMIWSTEEGFGLDESIDTSTIPKDIKKKINDEISHFLDVCNAHNLLDSLRLDDVAHNFYLSRNGHGVGFFDAKMENADKELLDLLQEISDVFGYDDFEVYQDEDDPEKEYEYYYQGSYDTRKAIILSDFEYLLQPTYASINNLSGRFLYLIPILGERVDLIIFLIENGIDLSFVWGEVDVFDIMRDGNEGMRLYAKEIPKKFPEQYKEYLVNKDLKKFNI